MKRLYYDERLPIKDIAKMYHTDSNTLHDYFILNDWEIRDHRVNSVNKDLKQDYFSSIDDPHKAYYLGLLLTDGSVRKNRKGSNRQGQIRIGLQTEDKDILDQMRSDIGVSSELIYDNRCHGLYTLEFSSEQIFTDLSKYSVIPDKTYEVRNIPTNIPGEYLKDFLRGMYDGDGCVTFSSDMSKDVTFNFTSYYKSMVCDFRDLIDAMIGKERHNSPSNTRAWQVSWRGYKQVVKILDELYRDADLFIKRKYLKYQQLLNRN